MRRRRGLLRGLAIVAGATGLAAGTLGAQVASATAPAAKPAAGAVKPVLFQGPPPAGFSSWQQVMVMQNRLNAAATKITAAAKGGDGLGSVTANPLEKAVRVYWKGAMPAAVSGLVGTLRQQASIRVLPARYSQRELLTEEQRLSRAPGSQIAEVAPLADASGLHVTLRSAAGTGGRAAAAQPAAPHSSVRLAVDYGSRPQQAADRYHDTSPFWGGAAIHSSSGTCTSGFSVRRTGETKNKLLTAAHCGANGTVFSTGDAGHTNNLTVGTMRNRNVFQDVGLLDPPAGASSDGHIYTGSFGSSTAPFTSSAFMPVGGSQANFVGNLVYGSGALSGKVGTLTVKAVNVAADLDEGGATPVHAFPLVYAQRSDLTNGVGNGDSGGPLFSFSDDLTHVIAKGTYTARGGRSTFVTCTGVPNVPDDQEGRHCSYDVYYAAISDALSVLSAGLIGA
jgi:hypothetical protein